MPVPLRPAQKTPFPPGAAAVARRRGALVHLGREALEMLLDEEEMRELGVAHRRTHVADDLAPGCRKRLLELRLGIDAGPEVAHRDLHRFRRLRHHGKMGELRKSGADICLEGGVSRAGSSDHLGTLQRGGSRDAIKVKPGVQKIIPSDPFRAIGNLVGPPVGHGAPGSVGRLDVIVHILLGAVAVAVLPAVLPKIVEFCQAWALRGQGRTVKFKGKVGGQDIEFEGKAEDLKNILTLFSGPPPAGNPA